MTVFTGKDYGELTHPQEDKVLSKADHVVAKHDIRGMFHAEAVRRGTSGVIIGHYGREMPTYRVRFNIRPGRTAVCAELTDYDIARN